MDLIAFQFGVFHRGRQADRPTTGVNFLGNLKSCLDGMTKHLFHHQHNIVIAMIGVIPQDHVVTRLFLRLAFRLLFRFDLWLSHHRLLISHRGSSSLRHEWKHQADLSMILLLSGARIL